MNKHFWRKLAGYALLAVLALQLGCSNQGLLVGRTPVPGSNIYCLRESTDAAFRSAIKDSQAVYGPYKLGKLGNGAICDLIQFYIYTVTWETKDGRKERYEFDLEKLMKKLQDENPALMALNQPSSQPEVIFAYAPDALRIHFEIWQYQLGGIEERNGIRVLTKPPIISKFPILTVPLTTPAATPAGK
jgi:hypothetical protein